MLSVLRLLVLKILGASKADHCQQSYELEQRRGNWENVSKRRDQSLLITKHTGVHITAEVYSYMYLQYKGKFTP